MPSKGKEGYKKLAQRGEDAKNFDWRSDEILELETKWGGIVDFADGKIDGYKLESVLRYGFFRVKAPVFADPFVKMQTLAVLVVIGCVALVFSLCHLSGVMHTGEGVHENKLAVKSLKMLFVSVGAVFNYSDSL